MCITECRIVNNGLIKIYVETFLKPFAVTPTAQSHSLACRWQLKISRMHRAL